MSWTDLDGAGQRESNVVPGVTVRTVTEIKWIASATGRLGYVRDRTLLYVKGGLAQMKFHFEGFAEDNGVYQGGSEEDGKRTGWTLGAGVEYALSPSWSLQLEYNFYDFGSKVYLIGGDTPVRLEPEFHSAQMAINYRFNLP